MKRPLRIGCVMAVFALLSATVAAAESGQLPRSFGNAQLAMAVEDLVRRHVVPADTASVGKHSTRTVMVRSQNPHIDHMAYRFYRGALYEQAIYYRRNRVPRGYAGLLQRLREEYGKPVIDDRSDVDFDDPYVFSSRKTVWRDAHTQLVLTETHKIQDGLDRFDLVLTMTDLPLMRERQQAEEDRLLQQERQVPIPVHHGRAVSGGRAKSNGPSVTSHGQREGG